MIFDPVITHKFEPVVLHSVSKSLIESRCNLFQCRCGELGCCNRNEKVNFDPVITHQFEPVVLHSFIHSFNIDAWSWIAGTGMRR